MINLAKKLNQIKFGLIFISMPITAYSIDDIAYLAMHNGYWQVWLMDESGNNSRQLTNTEYDKNRISWYPKGDALLVSGHQGELAKVSVTDHAVSEIKLGITNNDINDTVISAYGNYLAFSERPNGTLYNKLWLYELQTGKKIKIAWSQAGIQHDPVFSKDDKYLYFLSGNNKQTHDIWKYNIKTLSLEQITAGDFYNFDISVSTNNKLAFSSNRSGNYEIWAETKNGYSKLTDNLSLDGRPTWSNDNKSIYFESTRDGNVNIWKKTLNENKKPVRITNHEDGARYPLVRPK